VEMGLNPIDTGLLLGGTKIMFAHRTTRTVDREEPPRGRGATVVFGRLFCSPAYHGTPPVNTGGHMAASTRELVVL